MGEFCRVRMAGEWLASIYGERGIGAIGEINRVRRRGRYHKLREFGIGWFRGTLRPTPPCGHPSRGDRLLAVMKGAIHFDI